MCAQHERDQEVQVLWGTRSQGPRANRKVTAREGGAERSGERNRALTNRNRIRGGDSQGERAMDREALATKGRRRKSGDGAAKATALTWGGLASRLKGRRREAEREVSRGRSSVGRVDAKGQTAGRAH